MRTTRGLLPALLLVILSCGPVVESPRSGYPDWLTSGTYTIDQQHVCFCPDAQSVIRLTVQGNRIVRLVNLTNDSVYTENPFGRYKTITELIAIVDSFQTVPGAHVNVVSRHPEYGFPDSVYIDPVPTMADEEFGYYWKNLSVSN